MTQLGDEIVAAAIDDALLSSFPPRRCARIAASIDVAPDVRADILAASELDEATWEVLRDHWVDAAAHAASHGDPTLLATLDDAYLERCEEEHGPLLATDYAALTVATERGTTAQALAALHLPAGAEMPLRRVWITKLADDAALRREVAQLVERSREDAARGDARGR